MDGRSYVMSGSLSDFSFSEVLDVVALSRQHTLVELREPDGSAVASINLKAGHLVRTASDTDDPRDAFDRAIRADSSCLFHVYRLSEPMEYQDSGRIADVLKDITKRPRRAKSRVRPPRPVAPRRKPAPTPPTTPEKTPVAAPTSAAPERPTSTAPERPTSTAPERPTSAAPERPTSTAPERPTSTAPERPTSAAPSRPSVGSTRTSSVAVAVASPKGGVGKTTIALNLGISIARRGLRVTVIDADINGDILSLIDSRGAAKAGTYNLLSQPDTLERTLRRTAVPGLRVLPAMGQTLPDAASATGDQTEQWRALIAQALQSADVVLVDCPAGVTHTSLQVLRAVSHVLGVFQAETVASRSFEMFGRALDALQGPDRVEVAGVVVNMLSESDTSAAAYERFKTGPTGEWVLDPPIEHMGAFDQAADAGTPVQMFDSDAARNIAWVFDTLAAELSTRLALAPKQLEAGDSFLI